MLISISDLIGRSWRFGTNHWRHLWPYSAWLFLPNIVLAACGYLAILVSGYDEAVNAITLVLLAVLVVLNSVLGVWVSLSLTYATGHGIASGIVPQWKESFTNTSQLIIPTILASFIVGAIFIAGTLAFVIPGIIFTGWYLFVVYEIIFDNRRGMGALRASKSLVVGRWWSVVVRFFVPVFVFAVFAFALESLLLFLIPLPRSYFYQKLIENCVGGFASSLSAPFVMATTICLYINLKQTPAPVTPTPPPTTSA